MNNNGYVAITAAIFLSLVILAVASALGGSSFFGRATSLDLTFKKTGFFVARSCLDRTLLQLKLNPGYTGNETVNVGEYQCAISLIESSPPNTIIKARAQVKGATTNLKLIVNSSTLSTVSLEEVTVF